MCLSRRVGIPRELKFNTTAERRAFCQQTENRSRGVCGMRQEAALKWLDSIYQAKALFFSKQITRLMYLV